MANKARHLTPDTMGARGRWPTAPEETAKREFSRILVEELMKRNWKQADLALRVFGKYPHTGHPKGRDSVSKWVRGVALPEPRNVQKIAEVLGMNADELLPASVFHADRTHGNPAIELRQVAGDPTKVWLRIDRACSTAVGAQILDLLIKDDAKKGDK